MDVQNPTWCRIACLGFLAALAGHGSASAQQFTPPALDTPFAVAQQPAADAGTVVVTFNQAAYDVLREHGSSGGPIRLRRFALPGGLMVDLEVVSTSVLSPGAGTQIVGRGGSRRYTPQVLTLSGYVIGRPGSAVYLAVSPKQMNGYVQLGQQGQSYMISSGDPKFASGQATITDATLLPLSQNPWTCQVMADVVQRLSKGRRRASGSTAPQVRIGDFFIECDHEFTALFLSPEDAADYAITLLTWVSEIYRRDLGAELRIPDGYLRLWEVEPPWGVITTFNDISAVSTYWQSEANPLRNIARASVHVLTTPVFGGVAAAAGGLCTHNLGYEISSVNGFFPIPVQHTHPANWDFIVVAHEFGHTFGSIHTFQYNPPIDCQDGSGPDNGTIMSYCHLDFGVSGVGLRFHAEVQTVIRNYIQSLGCLEIIDFDLGDYNHNGQLDAIDLHFAALCMQLEFEAAGCLETFDLDGDGQLSPDDYCTLLEMVDPALPDADCNNNDQSDCLDVAGGLSADCNGNGVPDECDTEFNDCNGNMIPDECEIAEHQEMDCNDNQVPDGCDLDSGASLDCNGNGIPDECSALETDCNENSIPDSCDLESGSSVDTDGNDIPDECHQILHVPGDFPDIQAAIDSMNSGDTVMLADGVYTGVGNINLDFAGKAIQVRSANGPSACVIDCAGAGRAFVFDNAEPSTAIVDGLTITGGAAVDGGAMLCIGASSPTIRECVFSENVAEVFGGAIRCDLNSRPTIERCMLINNSAALGGGLACNQSNAVVRGCVFVGNSAVGTRGGAVHLAGHSSATISSCLLAGNHSDNVGGGISVSVSSPEIRNLTLVGNSAVGSGGGIFVTGSLDSTVLSGSVLWNNQAGQGNQIYVSSGALAVDYCDVQGGAAAVQGSGTLTWLAGNIDLDPLFADPDGPDDDPASYQDNNYHLVAGSPCIDVGNPNFVPAAGDRDLDDQPRVLDGDGDEQAIVDLGADEFAPCASDLNGNGAVDATDLSMLLGSWGPCSGCPADLDGSGNVGAADLAALLAAWGSCGPS